MYEVTELTLGSLEVSCKQKNCESFTKTSDLIIRDSVLLFPVNLRINKEHKLVFRGTWFQQILAHIELQYLNLANLSFKWQLSKSITFFILAQEQMCSLCRIQATKCSSSYIFSRERPIRKKQLGLLKHICMLMTDTTSILGKPQ